MVDKWRQYRKLKKGEQIYVGADTSMGCGDNCVAQFFSAKYFDYPLVFSSPIIATEMTDELVELLNSISDETGINPLIAYERNNGGAFEMERLAKLNKQGKFDIFRMKQTDPDSGSISLSDKLGWDTNSATRPQMLGHFKEAIDNKLIRIYDMETINEMFSFIRTQYSTMVKAEAEKNAHDDHVMAAAIAYEMYLIYPELASNSSTLANAMAQYSRSIEGIERVGY